MHMAAARAQQCYRWLYDVTNDVRISPMKLQNVNVKYTKLRILLYDVGCDVACD